MHGSIIYKIQEVETSQMSTNWYMDKCGKWYIHIDGIFCGHADWCAHLPQHCKAWRDYIKGKKPVIRDYVLYDCIHMKHWNKKIQRQKVD